MQQIKNNYINQVLFSNSSSGRDYYPKPDLSRKNVTRNSKICKVPVERRQGDTASTQRSFVGVPGHLNFHDVFAPLNLKKQKSITQQGGNTE